jgi:TolA-binding protein
MKKLFFSYSFILILLLELTSCSKKTDNEYWSDALLNMKGFKNKEAIQSLDKLVEEYPQSKYAIKALNESARLYHELKIPGLQPEESLNKAIFYNRRIINEYPKSHEAAKALFVIGYIEANELKDLESASKDYNAFLSKYPDNEYAPSVRAELANLGVNPEDIINKKIADHKK